MWDDKRGISMLKQGFTLADLVKPIMEESVNDK